VGEMLNWEIISADPSGSPVIGSTSFRYKLKNRSERQRLVYGERRYGINLVWGAVDSGSYNIRIVKQGTGTTSLFDGNRVAIGVDDGGYLRYQSREYGINLVWSESPVYEWELRLSELGNSPAPIETQEPVGLYNTVENDFLFYDPRQYGINLKWLRDEGKYNGQHWWQDVGDAISGAWSYVFNSIKEAVWRILGLPDFILSLLGILWPKKMRVEVKILRDTNGVALLGDEELPQADREDQLKLVQDAIDLLTKVFKDRANVKVIAAGDKTIRFAPHPAPSYALEGDCGFGFFKTGLYSRAGAYYRKEAYKNAKGLFTGYGQAITAIVIKDIHDKRGCSLGPLTSYLLIDVEGFEPTHTTDPRASTLAHEMGHQNGLWHRPHKSNLMYAEKERGTDLSRWQVAWLRDSRFVTFL
jgi:hypothetical protein